MGPSLWMKTIALCILVFGSTLSNAARGDAVAICLVVKDQNDDLLEFIDYHKMIGVGHFYIYDNNSTEPVGPIIRQYYDAGFVSYMRFKVREGIPSRWQHSPQYLAYEDCLQRARQHHKWLAFIDVDEFLLIKDPDPQQQDIAAFLKDYEAFGALAVNWLMFGSDGRDSKPPNSTLTSYTKCTPKDGGDSRHIKSIINTNLVEQLGRSPHEFHYKDDVKSVNENKQPFRGPFSAFSGEKIVLLHYVLKSKQEFVNKVKRGSGDGNGKGMGFFHAIDNLATETCEDALEVGRRFEVCCFAGSGAQRPKQQSNDPMVRLAVWWDRRM